MPRFYKKFFSKSKPARLSTGAEGKCAYVVGDIHGSFEALTLLLQKIESHHQNRGHVNQHRSVEIVFLGDLIDRGVKSKEVIQFLMTYNPNFATLVFLLGNHEDVFLSILNGKFGLLDLWFKHGGKACARSYGVENLGRVYSAPDQLCTSIQESVPRSHVDFISRFKKYHVFGDYLCVHAGIKPGVPLCDQSPRDLLWIRDPFLNFQKPHPYKVIHGHTVVNKPEIHSNRIAIDTGAFSGGRLTAAYICDEILEFL